MICVASRRVQSHFLSSPPQGEWVPVARRRGAPRRRARASSRAVPHFPSARRASAHPYLNLATDASACRACRRAARSFLASWSCSTAQAPIDTPLLQSSARRFPEPRSSLLRWSSSCSLRQHFGRERNPPKRDRRLGSSLEPVRIRLSRYRPCRRRGAGTWSSPRVARHRTAARSGWRWRSYPPRRRRRRRTRSSS